MQFFLKVEKAQKEAKASLAWREKGNCVNGIRLHAFVCEQRNCITKSCAAPLLSSIKFLSWGLSFLQMYDKDGSGTIELNEMIEVMTALQCMDGASKEAAQVRGRRIFEELDINDDGEISCEEFVRGCMMDPELVRTITAGGLDPLEEECYWDDAICTTYIY